MSYSKLSNTHDNISKLLQALLTGGIEASDFRLEINQFSQTMVKNLFRDSLPRFSSTLRDKFTNVFTKYFFNDRIIKLNDLWRFVGYKDFWIETRKLHDVVYSRNMSFNDIKKYFDRNLLSRVVRTNLSFLEQKIVNKLNNDPFILFKTIASDLSISEKKVSTIISNLRSRGIYLGSFVNYPSLNSFEFFAFDSSIIENEEIQFADEILLFPKLKLIHGIYSKKTRNSSLFQVLEKRIISNPLIFCKGITIQDWREHASSKHYTNTRFQHFSDSAEMFLDSSKDYIIHLMRNCEIDYKRPEIQKIAQTHNVSTRTLFRIKSKLKEKKILQPRLVIENSDLLNIVIISPHDLIELYNKVPFIRSFKVKNNEYDSNWISFLSIFASDFKFLYSKINNNAEIYQVINKKNLKTLDNKDMSIMPFKHKVYTK